MSNRVISSWRVLSWQAAVIAALAAGCAIAPCGCGKPASIGTWEAYVDNGDKPGYRLVISRAADGTLTGQMQLTAPGSEQDAGPHFPVHDLIKKGLVLTGIVDVPDGSAPNSQSHGFAITLREELGTKEKVAGDLRWTGSDSTTHIVFVQRARP